MRIMKEFLESLSTANAGREAFSSFSPTIFETAGRQNTRAHNRCSFLWEGRVLIRFIVVASLLTGLLQWSLSAHAAGAPWESRIEADHPYVGRIWSNRTQAYVEFDKLADAIIDARLVLLGEKHDNPDHHRLQAVLIDRIVGSGARPAIVWEMIDRSKQGDLDAVGGSADPDALADAADWQASGWPEWETYRPIAVSAAKAGLAHIAANLDRADTRTVAGTGVSGIPSELTDRIPGARDIPESVAAEHLDAVDKGHCGLVPRDRLGPMVDVQWARDIALAEGLLRGEARSGEGAVLIAGGGHTRTDAGVPVHIRRASPDARLVTVAFLEVPAGIRDADGMKEIAESEPADFIWWTPIAKDVDYCAELRERFGGHKPKSGTGQGG